MYDIIFSIPIHKNIECLKGLIENIKKYNDNNKILIILNPSIKFYDEIRNHLDYDFILINPNPFNKRIGSFDILKSHFSNFDYLSENKINFKYFCFFTSTSLFIKQLDLKQINNFYSNIKYGIYTSKKTNIPRKWHFKYLLKNFKIVSYLKKKNIKVHGCHISGTIYTKELFTKVKNFILNEIKINERIQQETYWEEILPISLEHYFINSSVPRIIKIFVSSKNIDARIRNIDEFRKFIKNNENYYAVKKVILKENDPIRNFIYSL